MITYKEQFISAFNLIAEDAHLTARAKGFWKVRDDIVKLASAHSEDLGIAARKLVDSQNRELMISEISEACEGSRKNLMDDKLPEYTMETAELADCIIRIMDHAAARKLPVAEALIAKMEFNSGREPMHGGKMF